MLRPQRKARFLPQENYFHGLAVIIQPTHFFKGPSFPRLGLYLKRNKSRREKNFMYRTTVKFENYDGEEREMEILCSLTEVEVIELEVSWDGGLKGVLEKMLHWNPVKSWNAILRSRRKKTKKMLICWLNAMQRSRNSVQRWIRKRRRSAKWFPIRSLPKKIANCSRR